MREVMQLSGNMEVTFHRSFDMCQNPMLAFKQLTQLGVARILTSRQQQNAELDLTLLRNLHLAKTGKVIMAGGEVRLSNLPSLSISAFRNCTVLQAINLPSTMRYRKEGATMCSDNESDKFSHYCVDGEMV